MSLTPPLSSFECLLHQVITAPTEEHRMYAQQRDEYLEHVCEMAVRKVSIITIFGTLTNSSMKIDHYQLGKASLIASIWISAACSCEFVLNFRLG